MAGPDDTYCRDGGVSHIWNKGWGNNILRPLFLFLECHMMTETKYYEWEF